MSPTAIVLTVSKESTTPDVIASPNLDVISPNEIKTKGDKATRANRDRDSLLSPLAQTVLTEFVRTAIATAPMMHSHKKTLFIEVARRYYYKYEYTILLGLLHNFFVHD